MRKLNWYVLLCLGLVLMFGAVACGSASQENAAAAGGSPQDLLTGAMERAGNTTNTAGSFEVSLAFDVDSSQVPEEVYSLLEKPMTISGSFAQAQDSRAIELAFSLSLAGESMELGVKGLEDKFWVHILDQWYEAPAEMMEGVQLSHDQQQTEEILALMSELGVDPSAWLPDLQVAEEELDGENVYRLTGHPDVTKIMTDVLGLMENEEFMNLVDPNASMTEASGANTLLSDPEEIQEIQQVMTEVFKDPELDLWITGEDYELRKAVVSGRLVPPPEEAEGLEAIDLTATLLFDKYDQPVKVEAPTSFLPFSELEKAMQENPEQFLGPFQSLMTEIIGLPSN